MHRHHAKNVVEGLPYFHPVACFEKQNPCAHGGSREVHTCACGAKREVLVNGGWIEKGDWVAWVVREPGCSSWAECSTLTEAKRELAKARQRGLENAIIVRYGVD